ncbi:MAG: hypothetical protein JJU35_15190 [Balneolales bacterium]|nr:hypothetical protein [Balneolales bacterium]
MNKSIRISKSFTVGDWIELRQKLSTDSNENWSKAIEVFDDRVSSRFLDPIHKIKKEDVHLGEGFSITALSVILCEFLAAFELGKIYKTDTPDGDLAPHEYSKSSRMFTEFWKTSVFEKKMSSDCKGRFYGDIRCGLVHEARTKGNSVIISDKSDKLPDEHNKGKFYYKQGGEYRFNRDLFLRTLEEYIRDYRKRLSEDSGLKKKFILKFDELAGLDHVWYFIYGSNLLAEKLNTRLRELNITALGEKKVTLKDYCITYNKASVDGTSKANINYEKGNEVHGIAILMLASELPEFGEKFEKGYAICSVWLNYKENDDTTRQFSGLTFISEKLSTERPSEEYVQQIVEGAREKDLPEGYIRKYLLV